LNCPYCGRLVNGWTGLQEVQKFAKHLNRCRKRPICLQTETTIAGTGIVLERRAFNLNDALHIRAKSGQ
jgi:hypothetical protein